MQIGIIGSGSIGSTAARLLASVGHDVALSNSRGPDTLRDLVADIGPWATAATVEGAADFGEVVLVAVPFGAYETLPSEALAGKIVVDATNYYQGRDGTIDFGGLASSELLARALPGARVVKAFNTLNAGDLGVRGDDSVPLEDRLALFVAGDDTDAKAVVSGLIEEVGFAPVDTGSLAQSRRQEPGSRAGDTLGRGCSEGDDLVALGDEPLKAWVPGVLFQQGDVGLLYLVLDAEGVRAVVAGARDRALDLLVVAVEPVVGLRELGHPLGAGAVEDHRDLVAGLPELLGGGQGVRYPPQVPVRLGVRQHDYRYLRHSLSSRVR